MQAFGLGRQLVITHPQYTCLLVPPSLAVLTASDGAMRRIAWRDTLLDYPSDRTSMPVEAGQ